MKALFIGGTGNISSACSQLALERGVELYLLNRGQSLRPLPEGARVINADIRDPNAVREALGSMRFDVVADFIAFTPQHIETDLQLFRGRTGQYFFISSASAYQTPPATLPVTEAAILDNPVWQYSRDKAACEERLLRAYREEKFPFTVVRPSHTYSAVYVPVHGNWTTIDRMLRGLPVIVHGDGTSLWTLTHSSDFAKGFVGLMGNSHAIGEVYHITSDEWLTWNQIHEILASAAGVQPELVHVPSDLIAVYDPIWGESLLGDKAHSFILDNSKIKRVVPDFVCTTPFSRGAEEIIAWHRADPARQQVDENFNAICERILRAYAKAWPEK
ncbi:MAG TPA: SDR family oxidoreductase [Anaerolineaceae bacterium]|jgi:nucleoside-diphosphate-sugar epimerase|nr:SDR family oxidoreductase [Anaerolineaceae bacterium]HOR84687.1 SDR family oxidoreductase [Anaerolineaceae bacterium]HOT52805.1 SDR family oxidoreductase [Anaerolineaceae bacterium]HPL42360.1 SDR family oxidoreductase [Anaerolineaceae bacterium]HPY33827.1 SDR family oxidoreductase [Anaerolineaceae bacterium]